jgi:hypothetical protein
MIKETLIVRSSISSSLLRDTLFKGCVIAGIGMLLLLLVGIFIPAASLHTWGWGVFFISLGLIAYGLLPYRILSRLQLKPNELILTPSQHLAFFSRGRKILTLPLQSVSCIRYVSHPTSYGIAVWLKSPPPLAVVVHQWPKEMEKLRLQGESMEKADLFFPYFPQRAYDELIEEITIHSE